MTRKQLAEKAKIARRAGSANLGDGVLLVFHSTGFSWYFSLVSGDGNTIDTATDPMQFDYICD